MTTETQNLRQTLESYGQLLQRIKKHKKLVAEITVLGGLLAGIVAYIIPPVYRSSTLILVQQQRLPSSYVQSSITSDLGERLRTLTPQIMSRTRLEQIIDMFHLYGKGSDPKDMERKVDQMRKSIEVQVKGEDTFRIYFDHRSPEVAQKTTQELARLFIEENLRDRAQQAMTTSEFLDSELLDLKSALERQENALRNYKERHLGVLPEQQNANLRALDRFQSQYQATGEALQGARARKATIEAQMSREGDDGLFVVPSEPMLEKMKGELAEKKAQFTDRHPDVRALSRKIAEMEKRLGQIKQNGSGPQAKDPSLDKLSQVSREVAQIEADQQSLSDKIALYQKRIESLPSVEEKLVLLTRDYETTRANYQALLNKKFEAKLSMNLEKRQKDDAFKILDPAYLPIAPIKPRRDLIVLGCIVASLLIGLGVAFVLESLDTRIRAESDLRLVSLAPVITIIPHIGTEQDGSAPTPRERTAG